jgi:hypothetical protein
LTIPDSTKKYHDCVKKFFEITAREKAITTKFVQRKSPIDGKVFLMSLVLNVFQNGKIVLDNLANVAHKIYPETVVSGQAFKERFNNHSVKFLKAMFTEALKLTVPRSEQIVPLLSIFSAVNLLDSSTVPLPKSLKKNTRVAAGQAQKRRPKSICFSTG